MTAQAKLVRLKPYHKKKGHVLRRYTYRGIRFQGSRGWYRVADDIAVYLAKVHQIPDDADSPPAFDVCTESEARGLDKLEAHHARGADHRDRRNRDPRPGSRRRPVTGIVDPSSYRVYNRHLTQRLSKPDDRDNPKIAFLRDTAEPRPLLGRGFFFPRGVRNVRVKGVFGYTEADGSPTGRTPLLIREVCKRLVVRELPLLSEPGKREDLQKRWRLIEEKTRDQSYKLAKLALGGAFTGDPEIDNVLVQFKRPADVGAA